MVSRIALCIVLAAVAAFPTHPLRGQPLPRPLASEPRVPDDGDDLTPLDPERADFEALSPGQSAPTDWLSSHLPLGAGRCTGLGQPLQGTSWLNRPVYVGGFLGSSLGTTLISEQVELEPDLMWGMWLGYDFSHYWGSEIRLAFNYAELTVLPAGSTGGNSRGTLADINLLYYPWGDARWRPYGAVGVGLGGFRYSTATDPVSHHTGFTIPLGVGVKYLWGKRWALRFDAKDNIVFGSDAVDTIHVWSLLGGVEFHWGSASAAQYYPWW